MSRLVGIKIPNQILRATSFTGNADGIANGIIVHPLALNVPASPPAAAAGIADRSGAEGSSGGGGGGGCFISASGQDASADLQQTGPRQTVLAAMLILAMILLLATGRRLPDSR